MEKNTKRGGRNLALLGVFSVLIAVATTGVSLLIYHNSGDIYLDRSRPGFLPDEEEINEEKKESYNFEKTGEMGMKVVEEYIDEFKKQVNNMDYYTDAFSSDALSDKALGID